MKKFLSVVLAILMMLCMLPLRNYDVSLLKITSSAATNYTFNADDAISFAKAHCEKDAAKYPNDRTRCTKKGSVGEWLCAEFVYNCLVNGGYKKATNKNIKVPYTLGQELLANGGTRIDCKNVPGKAVYMSYFDKKLTKGDVIIILYTKNPNGSAGQGHAVIYSGETDSSGRVKVYAHNNRQQNSVLYTASKTCSVYAIHLNSKSSYTLNVSFNSNGGSVSSDEYKLKDNVVYNKSDSSKYVQKWTSGKTKENGLINASTFGLTRTGYTFSGWGTKSSGGTVFDQNDKSLKAEDIKSDVKKGNCSITLYAIWTRNKLSVSFNANNGALNSSEYKLVNSVIYNKSDSSKYIQEWNYGKRKDNGLVNDSTFGLVRTGYTFSGWGTKSSGGTVFDKSDNTLTAEKINSSVKKGNCSATLYAVWSANAYTVKYNANGGSGSMSNSTHTYNTAKALNANKFTRTGYTFLGWSTSATATKATYTDKQSVKNLTSAKNGTVTLYAVWSANAYTIKYNANGGSGTMSNSTHTYNVAKALNANKFTRTGYTFLGWSTSATATKATYTDKQSVKNLASAKNGTVNFYAVWSANAYTVKYNANGGSGTMSNSTHTYNVAKALDTNKFTRAGYTFLGWSTSASATTASYKDKQTVKNLTNSGTIVLYAVWQKNAEVQDPIQTTNSAIVKVTSVVASAGDSVNIKIDLSENPGIAYLKLKIEYDSSVMTLENVKNEGLLSGSFQQGQSLLNNPYSLVWSGISDSNSDGNIVTLTFKINSNAESGDYAVKVISDSCSNSSGENISVKTVNGLITIGDSKFGDINNDNTIDGRDSTLLLKYLADWDVTVDKKNADVNNDGIIDGRDSTLLLKYLADWDVTLG